MSRPITFPVKTFKGVLFVRPYDRTYWMIERTCEVETRDACYQGGTVFKRVTPTGKRRHSVQRWTTTCFLDHAHSGRLQLA